MILEILLAAQLLSSDVTQVEKRDPKQVALFKKANACPSTGLYGDHPCLGYVVDHAYPLCLGGKDAPENMMYQTTAESFVKDRIEREACAWKKKYEALAKSCELEKR